MSAARIVCFVAVNEYFVVFSTKLTKMRTFVVNNDNTYFMGSAKGF